MGVRWKQGLFSVWAVLSLVWIVVALVGIYRSTSALIFTPADRDISAPHKTILGPGMGNQKTAKNLESCRYTFCRNNWDAKETR